MQTSAQSNADQQAEVQSTEERRQPEPNSLEHWATVQPHEVALIDGDVNLTFHDLNDQASRLAEALSSRGIGVGDVVAIRSQIRHEWQIVCCAVAKLGASLLPFNWRLTPVESRFILENSKASALVFDDRDAGAFAPAYEGLALKAVVHIDTPSHGPEGLLSLRTLISEVQPKERFSKSRPPLIIYTSGTTGRPKGVVMGDIAMSAMRVEYMRSIEAADPQLRGSRAMLSLPMHHGAGPGACWTSLAGGNTMLMVRHFDPEQALADIQRHKINHWVAVPTMLKRIAGLPPEVLARYDVLSIRSIRTGAAPVTSSLKDWARSYFGDILHEGYGATEVGMISHLSPVDMTRKPGSSGKPYKHVQIRIKDEVGDVLPAGKEGEIWVKTPAVINRYLNEPLLGRNVIDEEGYFQVGDVGKLDEDGYVYVTDRIKDMIISGGVNIYPAEIEAVIGKHPSVRDVAVIGVPDEEFGEAVKAFIEIKPHASLTTEELNDFLKPLLGSYKRPRSIEFVNELPRSTVGKILKRELRNPYWKNQERNV